eukprot:scaffold78913_cov51-Phaeocystis_antarctica.AAC.1
MKEQMVSGIVRSSRQPRDSQTLSLLQGHVGKVLYTELTDVSVAMTGQRHADDRFEWFTRSRVVNTQDPRCEALAENKRDERRLKRQSATACGLGVNIKRRSTCDRPCPIDPASRASALCVRGPYYACNVRGYAVIPVVDILFRRCWPSVLSKAKFTNIRSRASLSCR